MSNLLWQERERDRQRQRTRTVYLCSLILAETSLVGLLQSTQDLSYITFRFLTSFTTWHPGDDDCDDDDSGTVIVKTRSSISQSFLDELTNSRYICWSHAMKVLASHVPFVRRNSARVVTLRYICFIKQFWWSSCGKYFKRKDSVVHHFKRCSVRLGFTNVFAWQDRGR